MAKKNFRYRDQNQLSVKWEIVLAGDVIIPGSCEASMGDGWPALLVKATLLYEAQVRNAS